MKNSPVIAAMFLMVLQACENEPKTTAWSIVTQEPRSESAPPKERTAEIQRVSSYPPISSQPAGSGAPSSSAVSNDKPSPSSDKPTHEEPPPAPPVLDNQGELFVWQVAILQGKTVLDPCQYEYRDLQKMTRPDTLIDCMGHHLLVEVRDRISKRTGTVEERVNGGLDDFAQEQMMQNEKAKRAWLEFRSQKMECTERFCRFMDRHAFLNDRKLVVKIIAGDQDVFAHLTSRK